MFKKIIQFIQEAKEELKKVNWPTKKQTTNYTIAVIVISIAVALFLGTLDFIFSGLIKAIVFK